ncbi:MAG TPA: tetratricopeptide repeat protein [Myxococcales bacterium]|jgi:hypothetical protein|nr:tetratricopeptide repeat protein [Myxococcales bacterium]
MELRATPALLLLAACATAQPKRLVIPEDMRRPLATGPSVADFNRNQTPVRPGTTPGKVTNPYADPYSFATDDMSKPKDARPASTPGAPTAKPGAAAPQAVPAAAQAPVSSAPPRLLSPTPPTADSHRYTLRLVEHGRVWEVELPETTAGYEVRIPMGTGIETPTAADQELLGKTPPEGRSKSYLSTLAKIGEMYGAHRYELALIEAVDLEQQYPNDARLLAMKGSLFQRLGKTRQAREAWKKALEIDPADVTVAEALRALKEE